ncbi:hypothetical protein D9M71_41380 [compost metagenome]
MQHRTTQAWIVFVDRHGLGQADEHVAVEGIHLARTVQADRQHITVARDDHPILKAVAGRGMGFAFFALAQYQDPPQDFPCRVLRNGVDEFDVAQFLVGGNTLCDEVDQFGFGHR